MKNIIFVIIMLSITCNIMYAQNLKNNLLVHYKFDRNAKDESGNDFHGTPVNVDNVKDRNGNDNSAYLFDGTAYVDMPFDNMLQPDFPISISFWFKPMKINFPNNVILSTCFVEDNNQGVWLGFAIKNNYGTMVVNYGDASGSISSNSRRGRGRGSNQKIELNVWTHFAGVINSWDDISIYINGCDDGGVYSGKGDKKIKYLNKPGSIGRADNSTASTDPVSHFNGVMDDFYMWDRALTQADVTELYFGGQTSVLDLGGDKILCEGREYPISIQKKFDSVLWNTGDTSNTIIIKKPGIYTVEVFKKECHYFQDTIIFTGSKCNKQGCRCH